MVVSYNKTTTLRNNNKARYNTNELSLSSHVYAFISYKKLALTFSYNNNKNNNVNSFI